MPKQKVFTLMITLFFIFPVFAFSESFRVKTMHTIKLNETSQEQINVQLSYNDAVSINFPENTMFLKGIEVDINLPQELLDFPHSMAYAIYKNISPRPSTTIIDYKAEQITIQALPARISSIIQIPLKKDHRLKTSSFSTLIPEIQNPKSGPLVFRIFPVMKGLPFNPDKLVFNIKIKPLLIDQGAFSLKINYPTEEKEPISIRINEVLYENLESLNLLKPGEHHLSIVSDEYRNEVRIFTVEQAKITNLEIDLKDTTPYLFLTAPENAICYLNGELLEFILEPIPLTIGEHSIRFKIGDYEITKQITAQKGHDYSVSMIIDVNIVETP